MSATVVSGAKIRQARLKAGMTQAQLARAVNTSERNIVRWEGERNAPRMQHVIAIAEATGIQLQSLLDTGSEDDEEDHQLGLLDHAEMLAALAVALDPFHPRYQQPVAS